MKTVVVIPTYNERDTVESIIHRVFETVPNINVLIVDDNSPDKTSEVVEALMNKFPNLSILKRKGKEGLGKAYVHAFKVILSDHNIERIITMDADQSHDPSYIPSMLKLSKDYDLVIGSRYVKGGDIVGWEKSRKFLSYFGNLYSRLITRIKVKDLTAGYNVISTDFLRLINLDNIGSAGYSFTIEFKNCFSRSGARIYEFPIIFRNRVVGESKISKKIIYEGLLIPWRLISKGIYVNLTCIACDNSKHIFFSRKNSFTLYKCVECSKIVINPIPKSFDNVYNQEYFSGAKNGFGYVNYDKDKEAMKNVFHKYLDKIEQYIINNKNKKILDIGAATGFFMKIAISKGFKIKGIEYSKDAAESGKKNGLNISVGTIEDYDSKKEKFDVVTMFDVIEHIPNPKFSIKAVSNLLVKNGLLLINTPDSGSFFAKLMGSKWHLIVPPEHIHYFNKKSLITLLESNGFEIVEYTKIGKKFTLEYVSSMLARWTNVAVFDSTTNMLKKSFIGQLSIPINLRDNMFVMARKIK